MKTEVRAPVATSKLSTTVVVSEWEDNVLFDADDPDFGTDSTNNGTTTPGLQTLNAIISKGNTFCYSILELYCLRLSDGHLFRL